MLVPFVANTADVRRLSSVNTLVSDFVRFVRERFRAVLTSKRFFSRVNSSVNDDGTLLGESLVTVLALVRALSSVHSLVNYLVRFLHKLPCAE